MALVLKTGLDPETLVPQVRAAVRAIDPEQPICGRADDGAVGVAVAADAAHANMMLLTVFGAVALVLSAIGIYGVLAFGVAQRVREFGIRQALGADRSSILSLVLKQGLRTAGLGMALGLAASVALARFLQTLLFGVTPRDPGVFGGVTVLLFAVAMRPATSPPAAPRASIRWSRCGTHSRTSDLRVPGLQTGASECHPADSATWPGTVTAGFQT